jgi:protocatechuate 3,4-dioxygenase beta subunit
MVFRPDPHIHFKLRTDPNQARGTEFVSQLYFDDATSDRIYAAAPYNANTGQRVRNAGDGIFRNGGPELTVKVEQNGEAYRASFDIGLTD